MAENTNKVTVRFESTLENNESSPLLLSGPLAVFATVDDINDLTSVEMATTINESSETDESIIVFVNHIEDVENSQTHRGAYFILVGDRKTGNQPYELSDWQEILLGTHSHTNIDQLEELSAILAEAKNGKGKKIIVLNGDGTITLEDAVPHNSLPDLPEEITSKITEAENYFNYPEDSEWHHLDADLAELRNHYDWISWCHVGKGYFLSNMAVGNCRELYYALMKDSKKLFITRDMHLQLTNEDDKLLPWLSLQADIINYKERVENAIYPETRQNYYLFSMDLPVEFEASTDELFLFDENNIISDSYLNIVSVDNQNKKISFQISTRANLVNDEPGKAHKITILIAKNAYRYPTFRTDFLNALAAENSVISLDIINKELLNVYIKGELYKKPLLPKLYLATDEEGNIGWENTLLPTQTFYKQQINLSSFNFDFNSDESQTIDGETCNVTLHTKADGKKYIRLIFKNVFYDMANDFPMLLVDGMFYYNCRIDGFTKANLIYDLEVDPDGTFFDINDSTVFTLVVIKNTGIEGITAELARNYITKEQAIEIFQTGKISLSDYVKKSELRAYAAQNHLHGRYAEKGHNHDYRYANYHHTHPELAALIVQLSDGEYTEDDINRWLSEIESKNQAMLDAFIQHLGLEDIDGTYFVKDLNVVLTDDAVAALNHIIEANNLPAEIAERLKLHENDTLHEALALISGLFEYDRIYDDQVIFRSPIVSRYNIGGIKRGKEYNSDNGKTLRDLITDLLNPHLTLDDVREIMTPVQTTDKPFELKWYIKTGEDSYSEINPDKILDANQQLYFKVVAFYNQFGEKCEADYLKADKTVAYQKTILLVDQEASHREAEQWGVVDPYDESLPRFIDASKNYCRYFGQIDGIQSSIIFTWKSDATAESNVDGTVKVEDDIIWDSYGIEKDFLNTNLNTVSDEWEYLANTEYNVSLTKVIPDLIYGLGIEGENPNVDLMNKKLFEGKPIVEVIDSELGDMDNNIQTLYVAIKAELFRQLRINQLIDHLAYNPDAPNSSEHIYTEHLSILNQFETLGFHQIYGDENFNTYYLLLKYNLQPYEDGNFDGFVNSFNSDNFKIEFILREV